MRVAHFAQFGPNRAGMYATVKDLILAERALGVDAQFIDSALPCKSCGHYESQVGVKDDEITTQPMSWASNADLLVRHTSLAADVEALGIPIILCLHGRPESTFMLETLGRMPIFSYIEQVPHDLRYKAYITFWEEFIPQWELMIPSEKLNYVPAPVNLDEFTPTGPLFDFGVRAGTPNLVITDMWREDETPFNILMAAAEFRRLYCPTAKVHVFGLPSAKQGPIAVLARILDKAGVWGKCFTLHDQMPTVYRAADILLTPHIIATRVIREACASGIPIVAGTGCRYTPYTANPRDIGGYAKMINKVWEKIQSGSMTSTLDSRQIAVKNFGLPQVGKAMVAVFEKVLKQYSVQQTIVPGQRKVLVDIGGHIGESISSLYQQVDDAAKYQIFSFEPHPIAFKQLTQNSQQLKNVQLINKAMGPADEIVPFYLGYSNCGEGSTTLLGKKTGAIEYSQPVNIEMVDIYQWFQENIYPDDFVVVKINIEGGEYPLLVRMLDTQLLNQISRLYVQLHSEKFESPGTFQFVEQRLEKETSNYPNCKVVTNRKGVFSFKDLNS